MGGEGDIPDASFSAAINDIDKVLGDGVAVSAYTDWLVFVDASEAFHLSLKSIEGVDLFFHDDGAVGSDVDDLLKVMAGGGGAFFCCGHTDIELSFVIGELVGDDEKNE